MNPDMGLIIGELQTKLTVSILQRHYGGNILHINLQFSILLFKHEFNFILSILCRNFSWSSQPVTTQALPSLFKLKIIFGS